MHATLLEIDYAVPAGVYNDMGPQVVEDPPQMYSSRNSTWWGPSSIVVAPYIDALCCPVILLRLACCMHSAPPLQDVCADKLEQGMG